MIIVAMKETAFLAAMHCVIGGIKVQDQFFRRGMEAMKVSTMASWAAQAQARSAARSRRPMVEAEANLRSPPQAVWRAKSSRKAS